MKLGTQPRNIQPNPSALYASPNNLTMLCFSVACADMMRVFMTSTGEQIVVATNPAASDAEKCVVRLSVSEVCVRRRRLNTSYDANCDAVMRTARIEFGHTPFHRLPAPSSFTILARPSTACL